MNLGWLESDRVGLGEQNGSVPLSPSQRGYYSRTSQAETHMSRSEERVSMLLARVVPQPVSRAQDSVVRDRVGAIGIGCQRGYHLDSSKGGDFRPTDRGLRDILMQ